MSADAGLLICPRCGRRYHLLQQHVCSDYTLTSQSVRPGSPAISSWTWCAKCGEIYQDEHECRPAPIAVTVRPAVDPAEHEALKAEVKRLREALSKLGTLVDQLIGDGK